MISQLRQRLSSFVNSAQTWSNRGDIGEGCTRCQLSQCFLSQLYSCVYQILASCSCHVIYPPVHGGNQRYYEQIRCEIHTVSRRLRPAYCFPVLNYLGERAALQYVTESGTMPRKLCLLSELRRLSVRRKCWVLSSMKKHIRFGP